jgi:hypothetical protein
MQGVVVADALSAGKPMAEFWIRAAANSVPPPPGTGLPNISRVVVTPARPFIASIHLQVAGVDNPAWTQLSADEKEQYARAVLDAVAAAAPAAIAEGETSAWVAVKIWDWFTVPKNMSDDELDDIACKQVLYGRDRWECYGVSVGANQELPL